MKLLAQGKKTATARGSRAWRKGMLPALLFSLAPMLAGQEKGGLRLQDFRGALRLEGSYRRDTTSTRDTSFSYWEKRFRETLFLDFLGYYYHPLLLQFRLRADLGLEQSKTGGDFEDLGGNIDNRNIGYQGDLDILKQHPYPLHIYTLRKEARNRQLFARPTEAVVTESGLDLAARGWWIPSRFHYHHYTYNGSWRDFRDEKRDNFRLVGSRSGTLSFYDYSVEYNKIDTLFTDTRYNDLFAFASTRHQFSRTSKSSLRNRLFLRDQTGAFSNKHWGGASGLRLELSRNLYTLHNVSFDRSERKGGTQTENVRADTSIHHRLYESLDSHFAGRAERNDFTQGKIDRYGGDAGFAYRKKTFFGSMTGRLNYGLSYQEENFKKTIVSVLDEGHAVTQGIPIYLDHSGVVLSSIVVTDQTGLVVYSQSSGDYLVSLVGVQVRLDIPIGSRITTGQTILVDYDYLPYRDRRFRTRTKDLGFGFRILDCLSLDFSLSRMYQDLISGSGEETLDHLRIERARADLFRWSHNLSVEYEDRKSRLTPYKRLMFTLGGGFELGKGARWNHGASTWYTTYPDVNDHERGTNVFAEIHAGSPRATRLDLRGTFRRTHLRSDDGTGYDLEARFSRMFRKTTLGVEIQYIKERFRIASDQEYVNFKIFLERRF